MKFWLFFSSFFFLVEIVLKFKTIYRLVIFLFLWFPLLIKSGWWLNVSKYGTKFVCVCVDGQGNRSWRRDQAFETTSRTGKEARGRASRDQEYGSIGYIGEEISSVFRWWFFVLFFYLLCCVSSVFFFGRSFDLETNNAYDRSQSFRQRFADYSSLWEEQRVHDQDLKFLGEVSSWSSQ